MFYLYKVQQSYPWTVNYLLIEKSFVLLVFDLVTLVRLALMNSSNLSFGLDLGDEI